MIDIDFEPTEKAPEEKTIVQKIEVDQSSFEYNDELVNKSKNEPDLNITGGFDDRLGSSDDDSIV